MYTPELMEMILLQLPTIDLLHAQRVNQFAHSLVSSSPKLQRALFLLAEPTSDRLQKFEGRQIIGRPVANPLFGRCLEYLGFHSNHRQSIFSLCNSTNTKCPGTLITFPNPASRQHNTDADGSWRRMYLTQPPTAITVRVTLQSPCVLFGNERFDMPVCTIGEMLDRLEDTTLQAVW